MLSLKIGLRRTCLVVSSTISGNLSAWTLHWFAFPPARVGLPDCWVWRSIDIIHPPVDIFFIFVTLVAAVGELALPSPLAREALLIGWFSIEAHYPLQHVVPFVLLGLLVFFCIFQYFVYFAQVLVGWTWVGPCYVSCFGFRTGVSGSAGRVHL